MRYILVNPFDKLATSIGALALVAFPAKASTILALNSSTSRPKLTRHTRLESMPMIKARMPSQATRRHARGLVLSFVRNAGGLGRISARAERMERRKKRVERMRAVR